MNIKSALIAIACLSLISFAAIPEMKVTTQNNAAPSVVTTCTGQQMMGMCMGTQTTTKPYVAITNFQLTDPNNSRNNLTSSTNKDSIKVRGNSTANADKKPYKIKFGVKKSLFGKEEARSWALLANHYDGTFALNVMAFEMGKRMGLEFTPTSQFVDLSINNQYKGIYQLTETIQSHKGRVDLKEKHNGWLVEFDYHDADSDEKPAWFRTAKYDLGTFVKSPELDDTSFTKNPPRPGSDFSSLLNFVRNDVNGLVNKMAEGGFPTNGYRNLIDMESWAKYVLIQLVMDNFDFNSKAQTGALPGSNYAYKIEGCDKIKAGPLWDFDLAAGVTSPAGGFGGMGGAGSFPAHYKETNGPITPQHAFYKRLWEDPVFKAKYKKLWIKHKSDFEAMTSVINNIQNELSGSIQGKGANTWANNSMAGSSQLTTQQFNTEINNLKTWWTQRLNWVNQQIGSNANGRDGQLGIDASLDVAESPNTCAAGSSSSKASSSSVAASSSSSVSSSSSAQSSSSRANSSSSVSSSSSRPSSSSGALSSSSRPSSSSSAQSSSSSAQSSSSRPSSSSTGTTPILSNTIVLENLPSNAKIEVYNLQGKRIYSAYSENSENSQILRILVQTKGMYIVRTTLGSEKKVQRFVVN